MFPPILLSEVPYEIRGSAKPFRSSFLLPGKRREYMPDLHWKKAKAQFQGKARTFDTYMPPVFLGAFDEEKIAFIPYHKVQEVFYQNDFDWTAAPSDHKTKEFLQLKELVSKEIKSGSEVYFFYYNQGNRGLEKFIKNNFKIGKKKVEGLSISKNNFVFVYQKWSKDVKNTIQVDWNGLKKMGILDCHFFLADMLSDQNKGVYEKLQVILDSDHYDLDRKIVSGGLF